MIIIEKYNSIMQKPEEHRSKWALGLSVALTLVIFISFAFYKGFLTFGSSYMPPASQTANVVSVNKVPSPIESTKENLQSGIDEIKQQYRQFTDSVSAVLVPFFTGIDIYQRK